MNALKTGVSAVNFSIFFVLCILFSNAAIIQADIINSENSAYLLFGHQNNAYHTSAKKSDNKIELGVYSTLNYKDTNTNATANIFFSREEFDKTADFTRFSINPQIEYNLKDLILNGAFLYEKNYEDYEYGISNDRDKLNKAGLTFSAGSFYRPKWYGQFTYNFNKSDYEDILFTDRKTHNYSLLSEYNFFGKTYFYLKTGMALINYEKSNTLQDNKEYFLTSGLRGVLSDKVEGYADFTIKRKNYKSLTDITKALVNFEITSPLTKQLKLKLGFNFDVCENYTGEYSAGVLADNRYYELSVYKSNLNYQFDKDGNIDFTAKFTRKNYADILGANKPVDKLTDLILDYNRVIKISDYNFQSTVGARYYSKDITPVSALYSDYDGVEFYAKTLIKF